MSYCFTFSGFFDDTLVSKQPAPRKGSKAGHRFYDPKSGKIYETKKQCYYLHIRTNSLPRFYRYVGFTIRRKQRRLIEAVRK